MKRIQCVLVLLICILILIGCAKESEKGLSVFQSKLERASIGLGRDIENSFALCDKKMEKNFIVLENTDKNTSGFQQVEEVTVPDEEQIKTYLNMTVSEIEKVTGNTINEEESITVFSFEKVYKSLYLDNSSFYFLCKDDEMLGKPIALTFYGKYHDDYLKMIGLSKDMNFQNIMGLWGETEIEESKKDNEYHYRIKYERNGLLYSFVSEDKAGYSFSTYIELNSDLDNNVNILEYLQDGMENPAIVNYYQEEINDVMTISVSKQIAIRYYETDLNDDGMKDLIVLILSPFHSGSHGDTFDILFNNKNNYTENEVGYIFRLISSSTNDYLPFGQVYVLNSKTNGYHDLEIFTDERHFFLKYQKGAYQYVTIGL